MSAKTLSSEYLSKHIYFTARKDRYQTPSGKIVDPYFVVEMPASVAAMAVTKDNKIIMVRQYRHPLEEILLELPGGFIDPGETPAAAISRELLEETGYTFSTFHPLGITAANPGVLNNYTHLFLALGGEQKKQQVLDANEEIEIVFKLLPEVKEMLIRNQIRQSMHALCLFYGFDLMSKNQSAFP